MIGTDIGVYILDNSKTNWVNQSIGLPNVIVSDIEFNEALDKIYISTFGRGIWATDLSNIITGVEIPKTSQIAFKIYPSPNHGSFTISLPDNALLTKEIKFSLVNVLGREVYSANLTGKTSFELNLNLLPGIYYARVNTGKIMSVRSFIVE
jgi:hypothetical protein